MFVVNNHRLKFGYGIFGVYAADGVDFFAHSGYMCICILRFCGIGYFFESIVCDKRGIDPDKKYFFFDIDGTLTDKATGKIVPSAQIALDELQKAGHFVAIATGRAHYKARKFMDSVGLHDMVCCGGGGLVIHDELVQNIPLDLEKSKAIARQALSLGYGVLFALDDSIKVYTKDHTFQN